MKTAGKGKLSLSITPASGRKGENLRLCIYQTWKTKVTTVVEVELEEQLIVFLLDFIKHNIFISEVWMHD